MTGICDNANEGFGSVVELHSFDHSDSVKKFKWQIFVMLAKFLIP